MSIIHTAGRSSAADLAREMDRRGEVIEKLEAELAWQPIASAPEDEWVILATTGDHVGQAIMLVDQQAGGEQAWTWAEGSPVHSNHRPLGWRPMPTFTWATSPTPAHRMP